MPMTPSNNLFVYAPKELSTDAFLCWILKECVANAAMKPYSLRVFKAICKATENSDVRSVECERQVHSADIVVTFHQGPIKKKVLFENKTRSNIRSDQLSRYKEAIPDCDDYVYLKLAFMDAQEASLAKESGYSVMGADAVHDAILPLRGKSEIVDQYLEYLESNFIEYTRDIKQRMERNDSTTYEEREAQRIFLSDLMERLRPSVPYLFFKDGANSGGSPWTQLHFYEKANAYGEESEYLFYRIDKRSGRTYLRINQYADIDQQHEAVKMDRLKHIRVLCEESCSGLGLKLGNVNGRGTKESEALICFFDANAYNTLVESVPELTKRILAGMDRWQADVPGEK